MYTIWELATHTIYQVCETWSEVNFVLNSANDDELFCFDFEETIQ